MKNIFCIGPNKTGTTSLRAACDILGIPNKHSSEPYSFTRRVRDNIANGIDPLAGYNPPGFFADIWCPRPSFGVPDYFTSIGWKMSVIKHIHSWHPDTVFIYNRRELGEWLLSREMHVKAPKPKRYWKQPMRWVEVNKEEWKKEWHEMETNFPMFFRNNNIQLYYFNIGDGDEWRHLCGILKLPVPDLPFPKENLRASK